MIKTLNHFWLHTKSKRQDNIGVAQLKKKKENLNADTLAESNILVKQFQSIFTQGKKTLLETRNKTFQTLISASINQEFLKLRGKNKKCMCVSGFRLKKKKNRYGRSE